MATRRRPQDFECCLRNQPPLFPSQEEEVGVSLVAAFIRRCKQTWRATRINLVRAAARMKEQADRRRRPAPTYRVGVRVCYLCCLFYTAFFLLIFKKGANNSRPGRTCMHTYMHTLADKHTHSTHTYSPINKYRSHTHTHTHKHTHTCSTPFAHSELNAYIKSLTASKQVPAFRQGALEHSFTLISQLSPANPWAQVQEYAPARSSHTPLFRHGLDRHSSISSSQNTPFPRNDQMNR